MFSSGPSEHMRAEQYVNRSGHNISAASAKPAVRTRQEGALASRFIDATKRIVGSRPGYILSHLSRRMLMDFNIPQEIADYLGVLDQFIEDEIKPLEQEDDNVRFFDHRREWARTDFENGGLPRPEWEEL